LEALKVWNSTSAITHKKQDLRTGWTKLPRCPTQNAEDTQSTAVHVAYLGHVGPGALAFPC
jgi:hypothetical protein